MVQTLASTGSPRQGFLLTQRYGIYICNRNSLTDQTMEMKVCSPEVGQLEKALMFLRGIRSVTGFLQMRMWTLRGQEKLTSPKEKIICHLRLLSRAPLVCFTSAR